MKEFDFSKLKELLGDLEPYQRGFLAPRREFPSGVTGTRGWDKQYIQADDMLSDGFGIYSTYNKEWLEKLINDSHGHKKEIAEALKEGGGIEGKEEGG